MLSEVSQQWLTFQFLLDVSVFLTDEWFDANLEKSIQQNEIEVAARRSKARRHLRTPTCRADVPSGVRCEKPSVRNCRPK